MFKLFLLEQRSLYIMLFLKNARYKYVSKLTIKLLEEGFDLQEHLLALRRYHFMELADWTDLFIKSLWQHVFSSTDHFNAYYFIMLWFI